MTDFQQDKQSWQARAAERRAELAGRIPQKYLVQVPDSNVDNVIDFPGTILDKEVLEITEGGVGEILSQLASGRRSALDVVSAFIERGVIAHQLTNCLSDVFFDRALQRAKELDEHYKRTGKPVGPLHGLPISLKDQFENEGEEHNMSYVGWIGRKAKYNSVLVEILLKQGAVVYCRTNMSQGLWFPEGYNNVYGRTLNPYNRRLTTGGSSAGEGALVALRGSPLGVGSDIGGSVRFPAAFCGLYGLRPSSARIPYCRTSNSSEGQEAVRSVLGPISSTLDGLKIFTKAVLDASPWNYDPVSPRMPWSDEMYHLKEHGGEGIKLCFAIMWDDGLVKPFPPYYRALKELKAALLAEGHEVIDWEPFKHQELFDHMFKVFNADAGADITKQLALSGETRLPGIRLDINAIEKTASQYWADSFERNKLLKESLDHWMATVSHTSTGRPVDAILAPVASSAPPRHDHQPMGTYTQICNINDWTASVLPVTQVIPAIDKKLPPHDFLTPKDEENYDRYDPEVFVDAPVGIQVIGRKYEEEAVIRMTEIVDEALNKSRDYKDRLGRPIKREIRLCCT